MVHVADPSVLEPLKGILRHFAQSPSPLVHSFSFHCYPLTIVYGHTFRKFPSRENLLANEMEADCSFSAIIEMGGKSTRVH